MGFVGECVGPSCARACVRDFLEKFVESFRCIGDTGMHTYIFTHNINAHTHRAEKSSLPPRFGKIPWAIIFAVIGIIVGYFIKKVCPAWPSTGAAVQSTAVIVLEPQELAVGEEGRCGCGLA